MSKPPCPKIVPTKLFSSTKGAIFWRIGIWIWAGPQTMKILVFLLTSWGSLETLFKFPWILKTWTKPISIYKLPTISPLCSHEEPLVKPMICFSHNWGLRVKTLTIRFGFEPMTAAEKCAVLPPPHMVTLGDWLDNFNLVRKLEAFCLPLEIYFGCKFLSLVFFLKFWKDFYSLVCILFWKIIPPKNITCKT